MTTPSTGSIESRIAEQLGVRERQVRAAVELLDGGATVPFIARYRKEATGSLDEVQIRDIEERRTYLVELEERRKAILESIASQGKLTGELKAKILACTTKAALEDLYLPYKPKRRTKGMIAREAGLEPLADRLFADPSLDPLAEATAFVNAEAGFADAPAVLDGVRDLLAERWAEDAALVGTLREWLWADGLFVSKLVAGKDANTPDVAKFRDYFDYAEPIARVPSHRALAVFRGRTQEVLDALLPRYITSRVWNALLQSSASELAARQRAMKSATDNAEELIKTYTRLANQARQAQITQEISEIVGGANALAETK